MTDQEKGNSDESLELAKTQLDALRKFSHSTLTIWISAVISDALAQAILNTKMRSSLSERFKERLFENYGPLSSFAGRIDLSYALSIIERDTFSDLNVLKELRNAFAHPGDRLLHFEDAKVTAIMRKFRQYERSSESLKLLMQTAASCLEALGIEEADAVITLLKNMKFRT